MGSDWIDCELGDLIELKRGYDLPKTKRVNGGVPVVSSSGSSGEHNEIKVKGPGVVTGRYGTIGEVFYIEDDFWPLNTTLYVKDFKGNDPLYVYYFLKTIRYSDYTDKGAVPGINRNHIHKAKVKVPVDPVHQRNLALKLFNLDKKIELNQKNNQTLEKMAQALFKSWFVDFDPVFDNLLASVDFNLDNLETSLPDELIQKAQCRLAALNSLENAAEIKTSLRALAHELQAQLPTKEATHAAVQVSEKAAETPVKPNFNANPNILAKHANTHAHFPNEFVHNEQLGWIPKGWEVLPLESLIILIGGGTPKTSIEEYWNGEIPWFSVVDAPQDSDVFVVDTEKHVTQLGVDKSSTKILRVGTTIISARGTVGKCAFVGTPMAMNQSCYGINGINNISDEFIYYLTRHQVSDLQKRGHGSVFNTITRETFKSILLPFSGDKLTEEYGKAVTSLFDKILMNNRQNIELTKLRDTLLPKLISGKLQIPDSANVSDNNI
ncbi:restriction endonuclease subunit S [Pseudoalteromonas sp. KG3]|uniref:restriction endonuclease subunit S n=1 Tax=Pseudoalteromonas sp. KG3 TaxID=2951137 RepID=UPI002659065A|nr:restriction endonuclease subunit S [Pseudoalteromonas sp. KG3]WKD25715.1 restriction endonuclease subunit S [Pseudoalteromonas sp. KG3]